MSKHTPGTWKNRTMGDETDQNGGQIFSGKLHLATAHYGNGVDVSERSANARLISSAPDMLAALKAVMESVPFPSYRGDGELEEVERMVRAAIAAAEG